jgi:7-cyano-7-deazaguanine synthase
MCGILGIITNTTLPYYMKKRLTSANVSRGRDSFGCMLKNEDNEHRFYRTPGFKGELGDENMPGGNSLAGMSKGMYMANFRAEPSTERVNDPTEDDTQPYVCGDWAIVHNGTIANDKEIYKLVGGSDELVPPTRIDSWSIALLLHYLTYRNAFEAIPRSPYEIFQEAIKKLVGSWAIIAYHKGADEFYIANNYRPLYYSKTKETVILSSVKVDDMLLVPPYSTGRIGLFGILFDSDGSRPKIKAKGRALVVLSGGLDSTVVAAQLVKEGHEVEALHFRYGCRAEAAEFQSVGKIAEALNIKLRIIDITDLFKSIGHSRLLDPGATIADGVAGAEQAIEWVPARNTILSSIAIGIAEGNGFDYIALGINLEEAGGGYTDNVLDLYDGFNNLMQWIVGVGKQVEFIAPVGHLMKHEIVKMGLLANAPFQHTWSCYNAGTVHCGNCGPCFMRKTAFEMNGATDPVFEAVEVGQAS